MNTDQFLESIYHLVVSTLGELTTWTIYLVGRMPGDWPQLVKIILLLVGLSVLVLTISKLCSVIVATPAGLLSRWKLMRQSAFGKAQWATWRDLRRAELLKRSGLFLGCCMRWRLFRNDLFHQEEGHFITISSPGGGKTSSVIIPVLLEAPVGNSFVVTDPSGEITAMTARDQESKRKVIYLNPFFADFKKATGLDYKDSGFNPLDFVENSLDTRNQSDILAQYLMVTDRRSSESYFQDEGKELLSLFIAWIVRHEPKENRNLAYLYTIIRQAAIATLKKMLDSGDPLLVSDARKFLNIYANAKPHWSGVVVKAELATKRYIPTTPLAVHTSKIGGFDPAILKKEDVTVYVLLPTQHLKTNASWLNMVMGLIGESVGRAGLARPVTMLLDELPALGYLPDLRSQMRQHRKAGLRMWLFSQSVEALSDEEMYGEKGVLDMFAQTETKQIFNIRQFSTARSISEYIGTSTNFNHNLSSNSDRSTGLVEVPLVRPEDILKLGTNEQIILYKNNNPIKAKLVPYYTRRQWRNRTDPNPFRG